MSETRPPCPCHPLLTWNYTLLYAWAKRKTEVEGVASVPSTSLDVDDLGEDDDAGNGRALCMLVHVNVHVAGIGDVRCQAKDRSNRDGQVKGKGVEGEKGDGLVGVQGCETER